MSNGTHLHLAVALDGAGWHPAAWREPEARPGELLTAGYWADQVREAQRGLLDLVTIEDGFTLQSSRLDGRPDERTDQVRGRLDALLIAARVAPLTEHIGIVPTVTTTHTEPFHVSKSLATLDFVSTGRAGWRAQIGARGGEDELFGRRTLPRLGPNGFADPEVVKQFTALFEEAAEHVEAVRRLWDSWEDDAEVRDAATGRFIDRDKLHYVDFEGRAFSVRGPSITPRPPQGQPVVTALAHGGPSYDFAARSVDVVFVTPHSVEQIDGIVRELREARATAGLEAEPLHIFGELTVFLDDDAAAAAERKARLDDAAGEPYVSDADVFVGTPDALAEQLIAWREAGLTGARLRPAAIPHDLRAVTRALVPRLQTHGAFRTEYAATTLRGQLGLERPANRHAAAG